MPNERICFLWRAYASGSKTHRCSLNFTVSSQSPTFPFSPLLCIYFFALSIISLITSEKPPCWKYRLHHQICKLQGVSLNSFACRHVNNTGKRNQASSICYRQTDSAGERVHFARVHFPPFLPQHSSSSGLSWPKLTIFSGGRKNRFLLLLYTPNATCKLRWMSSWKCFQGYRPLNWEDVTFPRK